MFVVNEIKSMGSGLSSSVMGRGRRRSSKPPHLTPAYYRDHFGLLSFSLLVSLAGVQDSAAAVRRALGVNLGVKIHPRAERVVLKVKIE